MAEKRKRSRCPKCGSLDAAPVSLPGREGRGKGGRKEQHIII